VKYSEIDSESWTFSENNTFITSYSMSDTEKEEVTDSEDKEFWQEEVEAQALRHQVNNIVNKKQVMSAEDTYKLQTVQEQISFVKL